MNIGRFLFTGLCGLLIALPAAAQSAADLFQKGIHAQEAAGDLDSAIQLYRQVAALGGNNKSLAAQAQYQLVLCMLQKGDPAAAGRELDALARTFPDNPDLLAKARKLIPGSAALLPAPWGEGEYSQLDIKRGGVLTGDMLYYLIEPFYPGWGRKDVNPQAQLFRWELTTANSSRSAEINADRATMQPIGEPRLTLEDGMGDSEVAPLAGPAIDIQQSVFLLRRLPLAPGFKTTLKSWPLTIGATAARELHLTVTGIEVVKTVAGSFRCFKVAFEGTDQTFWIGVEGARPLVRITAGKTEAELVKTWGPESLLDQALAPAVAMGWTVDPPAFWYPGYRRSGSLNWKVPAGEQSWGASVVAAKIYTPADRIDQRLQERLKASAEDIRVRPDSVQSRRIGGKAALSWWLDAPSSRGGPSYHVAIVSENAWIEVWFTGSALTRWKLDPAIEAIRLP